MTVHANCRPVTSLSIMKSRRAGSRSRSADEEGGALNTVALATLVLTGILFLLAMGLLMYVHRRLAGGLRYPRVRGVCVCNSVSRSARPRIALRCTRPCSREASSQVLCNGTTESENGDSSLNPPPRPLPLPPPPSVAQSTALTPWAPVRELFSFTAIVRALEGGANRDGSGDGSTGGSSASGSTRAAAPHGEEDSVWNPGRGISRNVSISMGDSESSASSREGDDSSPRFG